MHYCSSSTAHKNTYCVRSSRLPEKDLNFCSYSPFYQFVYLARTTNCELSASSSLRDEMKATASCHISIFVFAFPLSPKRNMFSLFDKCPTKTSAFITQSYLDARITCTDLRNCIFYSFTRAERYWLNSGAFPSERTTKRVPCNSNNKKRKRRRRGETQRKSLTTIKMITLGVFFVGFPWTIPLLLFCMDATQGPEHLHWCFFPFTESASSPNTREWNWNWIETGYCWMSIRVGQFGNFFSMHIL